MFKLNTKFQVNYLRKFVSVVILANFLTSLIVSPAGAQVLPIAGLAADGLGMTEFANFAPANKRTKEYLELERRGTPVDQLSSYQPPVLLGLKIHPENPLLFDFIVDQGQAKLSTEELKSETTKLVKYFLAALTIPDKEVWVNLSPTEKDRIIPDALGQTVMGKTMLEEDYVLKQLASSLTNPDTDLGKKYWEKVNKVKTLDAGGWTLEKNDSTNVQLPTTSHQPPATSDFNKVWIMPQKAEVLESNGIVLIGEKCLKVMMAEDIQQRLDARGLTAGKISSDQSPATNASFEIFRSTILPTIEKEVNEGKDFAGVRQIYNSVILAAWYKKALKESLLGKIYADKAKVVGVETDDKQMKQRIYQQYLDAFKKGAYNLIKEETDQNGELIPRKYFSGGIGNLATSVSSQIISAPDMQGKIGKIVGSSTVKRVTVQLAAEKNEFGVLQQVVSSAAVQTNAGSSAFENLALAKKVNDWYGKFFASGGTQVTFNETPLEILQGIGKNLEALQSKLYKIKSSLPADSNGIAGVEKEIVKNKQLFVEVLTIAKDEIYLFDWQMIEHLLDIKPRGETLANFIKLRRGDFNDVPIGIFKEVVRIFPTVLAGRDARQYWPATSGRRLMAEQMVHTRVARPISTTGLRPMTQQQSEYYKGFYADFVNKFTAILNDKLASANDYGANRRSFSLSKLINDSRVPYSKISSIAKFHANKKTEVTLIYGWELAGLAEVLGVQVSDLWDLNDLRILNFQSASSTVDDLKQHIEEIKNLRISGAFFALFSNQSPYSNTESQQQLLTKWNVEVNRGQEFRSLLQSLQGQLRENPNIIPEAFKNAYVKYSDIYRKFAGSISRINSYLKNKEDEAFDIALEILSPESFSEFYSRYRMIELRNFFQQIFEEDPTLLSFRRLDELLEFALQKSPVLERSLQKSSDHSLSAEVNMDNIESKAFFAADELFRKLRAQQGMDLDEKDLNSLKVLRAAVYEMALQVWIGEKAVDKAISDTLDLATIKGLKPDVRVTDEQLRGILEKLDLKNGNPGPTIRPFLKVALAPFVVTRTEAVASAPVGGIDFDPTGMNLQIKRDGRGVPLPLPQQNLEQINIEGLSPVIINIVPINAETLPLFLGQAVQDPMREMKQIAGT